MLRSLKRTISNTSPQCPHPRLTVRFRGAREGTARRSPHLRSGLDGARQTLRDQTTRYQTTRYQTLRNQTLRNQTLRNQTV